MANMLMSRRGRAASTGSVDCHDVCDPNMAPRAIKINRRRTKRVDNRKWRKEATSA